jgi:hypothetical protein
MQPFLRGEGETAFFRDGNEVSEVPKLHQSHPSKVWL